MARLHLVTVFDRALSAYLRPFAAASLGVAIREFGEECKRPDSPLNKHPADYSLWKVGEFDDQTGALIPSNPEALEQASHYTEV